MKTALLVTRPLSTAVLTCGIMLADVCRAEEFPSDEPPASFILATPDLTCDEFNRSWKVTNQHSYHSIKVVVRWFAVGGREMQEEFILPPREGRALGCAPNVEVVSAQIMQF